MRRCLGTLAAVATLAGAGCGGEEAKPYTPAAARAIFARCASDAAPFAVEYRRFQALRFPLGTIQDHAAHALAGLGRTQTSAADALAKLKLANAAQAARLRGFVAVLRRLGDAQSRAAPLAGQGEYAAEEKILLPAQRPLQLLTYRIPTELVRTGALKCLGPQPIPAGG